MFTPASFFMCVIVASDTLNDMVVRAIRNGLPK